MSLETVEQVRAARAILGWTQRDLAEASGVSLPTIKRIELLSGPLSVRAETVRLFDQAFRQSGVSFDAGALGDGLRQLSVRFRTVDGEVAKIDAGEFMTRFVQPRNRG